jgi:copper chaperone CopZ
MRRFGLLVIPICLFLIGCNQPTETVPVIAPTSGTTLDDHDVVPAEADAASTGKAVRFVADTRLSVPGMMCPYGCYPAIKDALASVPGVEDVQLAEQPQGTPEGRITEKVVELKVGEGFNLDAAIVALKNAHFDSEAIN